MLDPQLLRKDLESVKARLATRKFELDADLFTQLENERKQLQAGTEELQAKRNQLAKAIGMKKGKGEDASAVMAQVAGIGDELKASAERLEAIQAELQSMVLGIPNLPQDDVPVGPDETANVEVRRWGTPKAYEFAVKDHVDLGTPMGLDFDTGALLSGARFVFLRGAVARL
ncbi:MAG: serine--tRNA ligase, partial [Burkholderiaceae bacterium]|nr:serine--tRNA ligase [Burkholderiaceae bacterium]